MRTPFSALIALLLLTAMAGINLFQPNALALSMWPAGARLGQDEGQRPRVMTVPTGRRRRIRRDRGRHRGIRSAFKKAGKSAGRGGRRFGTNMARGRPVRAGKEFGKGMGGFGKHTGKGIGRTMRRVFKP